MRFKDFLTEKSAAQQAAIAISKKEKGEKPKNEDAEDKARLALKHTQEKERLAQKHAREKEDIASEDFDFDEAFEEASHLFGESVLGDARTILYREKLERLGYSRKMIDDELDESSKLKDGDKVKTPQGTVEIKTRDTAGMRGKQDKFTMILHMKNGKKASMGSHPAPTASAVTNIAKRFDKGVPSYMAHLKAESVELDEAIGKLGPNASREDKIKHTMKIMKMYPANKGKSEKQLRKGATDYIDQFTNKNKRDNAYIAKMKAKKESVEEATNESVNIEEKNVPTNPSLWAKTKAQAKAKFDVYPSAYANGWAAKKYKAAGGGWKSVKEQKTFWDVRKK